LVEAMLAYDLIGFQTEDDLANFRDYVQRELGLVARGGQVFSGQVFSRGRVTRIATFPIGIDVEAFAQRAARASTRAEVTRLRSSLQGRKLVIGVDRLDYSKGLPNRLQALDHLFEHHPEAKKTLHMLQIAVLSRSRIASYMQLRHDLAALVGEINGRHGDVDWTPIRYVNRSFPHDILAGFYREARVGLITPLHDGMNLVAKEYGAAQDPFDPGVLVLSEFAGAARQLDAAVLVNPHDIAGTAQGLMRALTMPLAERRERWHALNERLKDSGLEGWFADFTHALEETGRRQSAALASAVAPLRDTRRFQVVGGLGPRRS
ncbi:MAG: trehalose-6-phosphate synthase, partial [Variibacter sp.]|nr:trehalose-6-phosphate synthase [Variibacter sp.]